MGCGGDECRATDGAGNGSRMNGPRTLGEKYRGITR